MSWHPKLSKYVLKRSSFAKKKHFLLQAGNLWMAAGKVVMATLFVRQNHFKLSVAVTANVLEHEEKLLCSLSIHI